METANWTIRFLGYLPVDDRMEERLQRVMQHIDCLPSSALSVDEDSRVITIDYAKVRGWLEESREVVRTVRVGRLVVKPPWPEFPAEPGDIVIEIDPGTAFGSGMHESTSLCLECLQEYVKPQSWVIDFGTGSGILAIAAAKLGAERVAAIDALPEEVAIARENVRRNGLEDTIAVHEAQVVSVAGFRAKLVTANIVADTIIRESQALSVVLESGGVLIASGITDRQACEVEAALQCAGFGMLHRRTRRNWVALVAAKA
jgi:ribosomal protein L11 methyltransferase